MQQFHRKKHKATLKIIFTLFTFAAFIQFEETTWKGFCSLNRKPRSFHSSPLWGNMLITPTCFQRTAVPFLWDVASHTHACESNCRRQNAGRRGQKCLAFPALVFAVQLVSLVMQPTDFPSPAVTGWDTDLRQLTSPWLRHPGQITIHDAQTHT